MKQINLVLFLSLLLAGSCSKDDDNNTTPDSLSVITIQSPSAGVTYLNGGTLRIEGTINDFDRVSTARVQVKNKNTGTVYYEQTANAGDITTYFFLWNWVIVGISSPVTATVTITARDLRGFERSTALDISLSN